MQIIGARNLKDLWNQLWKMIQYHPTPVMNANGSYNFRGDIYLHLYDIFFQVRSSTCPNLYLEDIGYSPNGAKVRVLLGKYLNIEWTNQWLDFITEMVAAHPDVAGDIIMNTKKQKTGQGGCINSFIFRNAPEPVITIITRAIEMPTKGMADVLLVSAVSKLLCQRLELEDIKIQWYFSSAWTRTRTAYYYVIYRWPRKVHFASKDFQKYLDKGWDKYYLSDYEFTYSANIRAKQLFLRKQAGDLTHNVGEDFFYRKLKEYLR